MCTNYLISPLFYTYFEYLRLGVYIYMYFYTIIHGLDDQEQVVHSYNNSFSWSIRALKYHARAPAPARTVPPSAMAACTRTFIVLRDIVFMQCKPYKI